MRRKTGPIGQRNDKMRRKTGPIGKIDDTMRKNRTKGAIPQILPHRSSSGRLRQSLAGKQKKRPAADGEAGSDSQAEWLTFGEKSKKKS